jgi:predicted transcriptional regulator
MTTLKEQIATVPCGCCRGTGQIPLGDVYRETIELLRRQSQPVNGAELARQAGCKNEAMCNRLIVLEKYGMATSRRDGRERIWTALPCA